MNHSMRKLLATVALGTIVVLSATGARAALALKVSSGEASLIDHVCVTAQIRAEATANSAAALTRPSESSPTCRLRLARSLNGDTVCVT
jgi:hypothetical protein